jgi:rod shape-determining protein MreC
VFFPKRKLIAFLFLFCIVFLVFFFSSQPNVYTIRAAFSDLAKFPLLVLTGLTHEIRAVAFFHRSYWHNLKLRHEIDALKAQLLKQEEDSSENERLRALLDLKSRSTFKTAAAFVIGKDFNSFRPYLILDKGASSAIKKYDPVLTPSGLVGKVLEVGRFSSKIVLINDPDLSVPALNVRTREQGLVSGTLDGRCKLRFLDADSDVKESDLIVTSGLNMSYPEGIVIGKVRLVGIESSGLGKFAILEPAVRVSSIEEVLIVVSR